MRKRYEEMPSQDTPQGRAAYMREWRRRNPERYRRENEANKARNRALWRLARLHPDEFDALVTEEMAQQNAGDAA